MQRLLTFLLCVGHSLAYFEYQAAIPNGAHVPHPCKVNFIWHGVGHLNVLGGGDTNPFGRQFEKYRKWTPELCQMDADGDGMTNGQELGDPYCEWQPGQEPFTTDGVTHPGICEPFGSDKCQGHNDWVKCEAGEFECDAIKEPDVQNITVRLPRVMDVPEAGTTYMCHVVDLPDDDTYHVIASQALIDNANILHHIIMFGCGEEVPLDDEPFQCNMANDHCNYILGIWTVGMAGDCIYQDAGYKIGKGTPIKRAWLQFHWNNPHHHQDYTDQSGMTIFYTSKLRPYDASIFTVGQMKLNIPPGHTSVKFMSTCHPSDTQVIVKGPVNVTTALNHMHYMGISQRVELWRDGQHVLNLADDPHYVYDDPKLLRFDPPVQFQPGDELRTFCEYRSTVKTVSTFYGEGSYDEMCYSVFSFYPAENIVEKSCLEWGRLDYEGIKHGPVNGCDHRQMVNTSHPATKVIIDKVLRHCSFYGPCRPECAPVLKHLRETNPCFQGELWEFIADLLSKMDNDVRVVKFLAAFNTCHPDRTRLIQTLADTSDHQNKDGQLTDNKSQVPINENSRKADDPDGKGHLHNSGAILQPILGLASAVAFVCYQSIQVFRNYM